MPLIIERNAIEGLFDEYLKAIEQQLTAPEIEPRVRVHEMRKLCKKVRSTLRLIRDNARDYQGESSLFRRIGKSFTEMRDADALLEALEKLTPSELDLEQMSDLLQTQQEDVYASYGPFEDLLADAHTEIKQSGLDNILKGSTTGDYDVTQCFLKSVNRFTKGYHRCLNAPEVEHFHNWRKAVKSLFYQHRLIAGVLSENEWQSLERLGSVLGDAHDYALMKDRLHASGSYKTNELSEIESNQRALESEALKLGKELISNIKKGLNCIYSC